MLIRLAGRQAAVATTLSLKATLAIQPRLADGNVADGRGIDPRGSLSRMTRSAALPAMITPVKFGGTAKLHRPSPSVTRPRRVLSPQGSARRCMGPRDRVADHPQ